MNKVIKYNQYSFFASHMLCRLDWDADKNKAYFGPCANQNGHGHNFDFTIGFLTTKDEGERETGDGFVDVTISSYIHQHLNMKSLNDFLAYEEINLATCEAVALKLIKDLSPVFFGNDIELKSVVLKETRNNFISITL
jgi:6-pyruvoyltetrahydropterin/6-carboxytetrahydropterin synthase